MKNKISVKYISEFAGVIQHLNKENLINELEDILELEKNRKEEWTDKWSEDKQLGYIKGIEYTLRLIKNN